FMENDEHHGVPPPPPPVVGGPPPPPPPIPRLPPVAGSPPPVDGGPPPLAGDLPPVAGGPPLLGGGVLPHPPAAPALHTAGAPLDVAALQRQRQLIIWQLRQVNREIIPIYHLSIPFYFSTTIFREAGQEAGAGAGGTATQKRNIYKVNFS
uniref:Uncharacterized protein n=1 Tax=Amphimedon queenslandica TaxID=400682 RepID=A0A1X7UNC4_AMPQE